MSVRFKRNRRMDEQLKARPQYGAALEQLAQPAAQAARMIAPKRTRRGYATTIRVQRAGLEVRLISTDPFAHLVEWGSANNPPYAPLRRGVRAAGLRLIEHTK